MDQCADSQHALLLCAELVVVDHFGQAIKPGSQGMLTVLVEKELRIGKPWPHHPLVASDDSAGVKRCDVADHQKLMGELVFGVEERKVFLIGLHGQNQAFWRHL